MNVLSLFDGISGGRVALERANITVDKYYASEIDKWAIAISKKNYPDIIQLGDINNWRTWDIDWKSIDLLFAGFCCQSWSQAGKQQGDKDPRGALMWVMLDIFNHIKTLNPNVYFLFENVKMKKEFLDYVNKAIGCESILINSALVSAQNRQRNYWTNIPNVTQPEDKRIYLKDIIEYGEVDRDKSYCIDANYYKGGSLKNYLEKSRRQLVLCQSEQCLMVKDYAPRFTPN
jgi:DNA (cytosine-5)-methyltransferase 1/DNA (cytosine-5)-methyltransferase 3A